MDPVSVSAGCIAVATAIGKASISIAEFVRRVRGARADLVMTSRQLGELSVTLELLRGEDDGAKFPESFRANVKSILQNCECILDELNSALANHSGGGKGMDSAKWVLFGKEEVTRL